MVGVADTGRKQNTTAGVIYDDCYQEDWDNYLDIIIDASSRKAALALKQVRRRPPSRCRRPGAATRSHVAGPRAPAPT